MVTTRQLAYEREDLAEAEFALNSDAGGGNLNADGKALVYTIQAAEKTYVTWEMTVRNPGGHSSRPRPDNAIYDLADAISKIQAHRFPVRWNPMTLEFFQATGEQTGGELGDAMVRFAKNPEDTTASDRLAVESSYVGTTRTTCVVTMLRGGHAENALPQSATATVNCRVFVGVPAAEVLKTLQQVVGNDAIEFKEIYAPVESPVSDRRDVRSSDVPGMRDGDSNVFSGQLVGIREVDDQGWQVRFMEYDLGFFDKEQDRVEPDPDPFTPDNVLTMCPE
jgi:carboxypeptidase PM20D1